MAATKFTSISQLTVYLDGLETRLDKLEYENEHLREEIEQAKAENQQLRNAVAQAGMENPEPNKLLRFLPQTGLLSHNFLTRAFTVWGHYFVAQLIIGLGFAVLYAILMLVILGSFSAR